MRIGLLIPTWNAGPRFVRLLEQINRQTCLPERKLVIDSSSTDGTAEAARKAGCSVIVIPKEEFRHGETRQRAFEQMKDEVDCVLCLTQDVLLHDDSCFERLLSAFQDNTVGAAYGRQLPHEGASISAALQREFVYPAVSHVNYLEDRKVFGIKTPFLSNSFAAYQCRALDGVGGFPVQIDICEDVYVGAKLLLAGYGIAYAADAQVHHSHDFSFGNRYRRYVAIGRFYHRERWITDAFGSSETEGLRLLRYQIRVALQAGGLRSAAALLWDDLWKYIFYCYGRSVFS